jgi:hypothetical protein
MLTEVVLYLLMSLQGNAALHHELGHDRSHTRTLKFVIH